MINLFLPLVIASLCYASCKASSTCDQKMSFGYLDAAIDLIGKAKNNLPALITSEDNLTRKVLDCSELLQMGYNKSGVYKLWPVSRVTENKPLEVYCDMETNGGGWTLIQRRGDFGRPVNYFHKDWSSYKEGFGDIEKDFWLGNDNIFALTNQKVYSARFELRDVENESRYAHYNTFWIDDENNDYRLHLAQFTGDAGDSMINHHDNQKFSAADRDNDNQPNEDCVKKYKGGWWYNSCHFANLNGLYLKGKHDSFADGINWHSWKDYHESMESTEIKIRPRKFMLPHSPLNTPI